MPKKKIIHIHSGRSRVAAKKRSKVYTDSSDLDKMNITQEVTEFMGLSPEEVRGGKFTQYDELFHTIYDAVIISDFSGEIININSRAEHYFAMPKNKLCALNILDLIAGADSKLLDLLRANIGHEKYTVIEATCVTGEETRFFAEIVGNALVSDDKDELCFFIRDITERKEMEENLKHANDQLVEAEKIQARIDTIATVIHELNNPLQVLMCMSEEGSNKELQRQVDSMLAVLKNLQSGSLMEPVVQDEGDVVYDVAGDEVADTPQLQTCDIDRILVVDDEDMLRTIFTDVLKRSYPNKTVDGAANGQEAVDMFTEQPYGVIIMDISMPVMNGKVAFETIAALCEKNNLELPSVIFCTAFVVSDELSSIVESNANVCCVHKPISMQELVDTVDKYLVPAS